MKSPGIPRGVEILVKKAVVDAEFRAALLEKRADAAKDIELELDPAEAAMLDAIPVAQLEAIISSTKVDEKTRPALLGKAAAVMIAALGVGATGCRDYTATRGTTRSPRRRRIAPAKASEERTEAGDAK